MDNRILPHFVSYHFTFGVVASSCMLCALQMMISLPHLGFGFPKFSRKPKTPLGSGGSSKAGEGIVLLSSKPIGEGSSLPSVASSASGITLLSKKLLDASSSDLDGESS